MRKKESLGALIGFLVLSMVLFLSPSHAAQSNPMTIAELTLYKGTDREKILLDGAKREGQVTFYTSNTWVAGPMAQEFGKKYPFIKRQCLAQRFKGIAKALNGGGGRWSLS